MWKPNGVFLGLAVLMLCLGEMGLAQGEEIPPVPDDPARKAQIERWVEDLKSPEYDVREAATRTLREAGADALFALIPTVHQNDDPEMTERIKQILIPKRIPKRVQEEFRRAIATLQTLQSDDPQAARKRRESLEMILKWLPVKVAENTDRLIDALKTTRDPEEWLRVWHQLPLMGEIAIEKWSKVCSTPKGEATLELKLTDKEIFPGEPAPFEVRLTNTGQTGIWIKPKILRVTYERVQSGEDRPVGEDGPGRPGMVQWEENPPPFPPFLYLSPQESFVRRGILPARTTGGLDVIRLNAEYRDIPFIADPLPPPRSCRFERGFQKDGFNEGESGVSEIDSERAEDCETDEKGDIEAGGVFFMAD